MPRPGARPGRCPTTPGSGHRPWKSFPASAAYPSMLRSSEIDRRNIGVLADLRHAAFFQELALVQHRDPPTKLLDEAHVMVDHQHRVPPQKAANALRRLGCFGRTHAGGG